MARNIKVIRIPRGFLGLGERRRHERTIAKWEARGWRYVETVKKWGGYDLIFRRPDS